MDDPQYQEVMDAEGREKLLAAALMAVLRERDATGGQNGIVVGVDEGHFMFFVDGNGLHMTKVDENDPAFPLGMFEIDHGKFTVN